MKEPLPGGANGEVRVHAVRLTTPRKLGLSALIVLAGLGLTEIAVRGRAPDRAPWAPAPEDVVRLERDAQVGWIFPANVEGRFGWPGASRERTDGRGLRNPAPDGREAGARRIVVLGDSFVFGWAVREQESFPRQLERIARDTLGVDVVVTNAGMPGFSVYQQRVLLERLLVDVDVAAVISTFTLSNDVADEARIRQFAPDRLMEFTRRPHAAWPLERIVRASHLLRWLDLRARAIARGFVNVDPGSIRLVEESFCGLIELCRSRRIPLLLVVMPRRLEVEGTPQAWLGALLTWSARGMHARVAARYDVPVLDVTRDLVAAHAVESIYPSQDPHWTPRAHRAVAEAIVASLAAGGVLTVTPPPATSRAPAGSPPSPSP